MHKSKVQKDFVQSFIYNRDVERKFLITTYTFHLPIINFNYNSKLLIIVKITFLLLITYNLFNGFMVILCIKV